MFYHAYVAQKIRVEKAGPEVQNIHPVKFIKCFFGVIQSAYRSAAIGHMCPYAAQIHNIFNSRFANGFCQIAACICNMFFPVSGSEKRRNHGIHSISTPECFSKKCNIRY